MHLQQVCILKDNFFPSVVKSKDMGFFIVIYLIFIVIYLNFSEHSIKEVGQNQITSSMIKIYLSVAAVFMCVSACNQGQDIKPVTMDFSKELHVLSEMNKIGFDIIEYPGSSIEREQFLRDILLRFNGKFFKMDEGTSDSFINKLIGSGKYAHVIRSSEIDLYEVYNEGQLKLVQPFVDTLLEVEDMRIAKAYAEEFVQTVILSSISDEDKLELLVIGTGVVGVSDFILTGGIETMSLILGEAYEANAAGKTYRCRVNSRNVWLGAVVGLSVGASVGGYAGCTGGMVGGPIGMAGGCVGGAVMGGASGFIWGSATSVAAELLGSCFRP